MSLSARLKSETLEAHQQLEKQLVPFMKSVNSSKSYANLLSIFYGFTAPTEQLLDRYLVNNPVSFHNQRRKADWILDDLKNLSSKPTEISFCEKLPEIQLAAQAMGMLYVLEGSTLGGSVIAKMLQSRLLSVPEATFYFFEGYKEQTMPYWFAFKNDLDKLPVGQHQLCIDAANETFKAFSEWTKLKISQYQQINQ